MDPLTDPLTRAAWILVSSEGRFESPVEEQQNLKGNVIVSETVASAGKLPPYMSDKGLNGC